MIPSRDKERAAHNVRVEATREVSQELQRLGVYLSWPTVLKVVDIARRVPATPVSGNPTLPEPDGFLETHPFGLIFHQGKPSQAQLLTGPCPPMYTAATVRAVLASAQQDAARYRWVREQAEFFPLVMDGTGLLCAELAEAEAEIDAAIEAAPKEPAP